MDHRFSCSAKWTTLFSTALFSIRSRFYTTFNCRFDGKKHTVFFFYDFYDLFLIFSLVDLHEFLWIWLSFQVFAAIQHVKFVSKHSHVNQRLKFIIAATQRNARSNAPFVIKRSQQRLVNKMPLITKSFVDNLWYKSEDREKKLKKNKKRKFWDEKKKKKTHLELRGVDRFWF